MNGAGGDLGPLGEQIAARYLEAAGYRVLARNYRLGRREVDLVVGREGLVAFVEVKTRSGAGYGHPLHAVTRRKRNEIERVARAWVQRNADTEVTYRFDAIGVWLRPGEPPAVEHVPGAWRLGE